MLINDLNTKFHSILRIKSNKTIEEISLVLLVASSKTKYLFIFEKKENTKKIQIFFSNQNVFWLNCIRRTRFFVRLNFWSMLSKVMIHEAFEINKILFFWIKTWYHWPKFNRTKKIEFSACNLVKNLVWKKKL